MRIGYLFRGYLGDIKLGPDLAEVSSPDGNATYSWTIEHECWNRRPGHTLIPLGENLDRHAAALHGGALFSSFSQEKRARSYERMLRHGWSRLSDRLFPELDLVLIEWRWPIPGRNTPADRDSPHFQGDLDRQQEVLKVYGDRGTPIVLWDLDHKLTWQDEEDLELTCDARPHVIETAVKPRGQVFQRHRVEPPCIAADLLQHDIDERRPAHHLGYIGSRYERDAEIDRWIAPVTPNRSHKAKFWGKWEPADEVRQRWPGITFAGRIGVRGFRDAYSRIAAVPLLAKESYRQNGFITPRPWEAVLFGSIPVGLGGHLGVEQYTDHVALSAEHLMEIATHLRTVSPIRRRVLREEAAHRLSHMDARRFVDVLEGLVDGR